MKKVSIIIATHKEYEMPKDKIYLPVFVGSTKKSNLLDYQRDDDGVNISVKNPFFCELTGLYWAWKNLDSDYVGLVHYRRYFCVNKKLPKDVKGRIDKVLNSEQLDEILNEKEVVLPKKRKYYIEDLYSHYKHTLYVEPLDITEQIIKERYPQYFEEFEKLHSRTSAHMFNMFIMKKEIFDNYCEWLFDILFELEKRVDVTKYDSFHARFFGRVSELLLDVWINTNNISYKEVNVIDIEKVNWLKKGTSFLKAKFTNKKYKKSF